MAECPFCRTALEQSDVDAKKCLVCGKKLPPGMVLVIPMDDPGTSTQIDNKIEATCQVVPPEAVEPVAKPGSATHEEHRIAATVDIGQLPPEVVEKLVKPGSKTHVDQRIAATVDIGQLPPEVVDKLVKPGTKTHADDRNAATVDIGALAANPSGQVPSMWAGNYDKGADPRTSIGRAGVETGADEPNLVIQPRILADPKTAGKLAADYELIGQLGKGGMGVVLAARQASVDRTVALKKINAKHAQDPQSRRKFLAEAVVTGDLEHPNIVPIYDLGKDSEGLLFYSMKHVKGTPWDQVIAKKSVAENVEILMKVADAVAFAHSRNVVHRDLKPENVMLGGYGEVLVMDWGLALKVNTPSAKAAGVGGTPAYMAPEMIFNRPEDINFSSDVYLLGAILYEIITGSPPHSGSTVSECLMAASKNAILPTDKSDELVAISLKAMSTMPSDRYANVGDFQEAIRQYWSHSQSILLSTRAEADLKAAAHREDYDRYARALLGFQEAHELWEGNARAKEGIAETSLAYSRRALSKGNLDLAASLLDESQTEHRPLLGEIRAAQHEQDARQHRLKTAKRIGAALVAAIFLVVSVAFFWIKSEYNRAETAKTKAVQSERVAIFEKENADAQKVIAQKAEQGAIREKNVAEAAKREEVVAKGKAIEAKNAAVTAKEEAVTAKEEAVAAKEKEEYGAYIARIGLASAKIDENAFGMARTLLDECPERLRNWEWGRLMHLCAQSDRTIDVPERIETVAVSPDGKRFVTGGLGGTARLWDAATGKEIGEFQTAGQYIFAAAFSPDGKRVALGTNDRPAYVKIFDVATGKLAWEYRSRIEGGKTQGHEDAVLSVAFSRDGKRLLTSSYDNTARLWDLEKGTELRVFRGHDWWVWSAAFSPDEHWIVTASQDGSASVWDVDSGEARATFRGHAGPVYTATFAPASAQAAPPPTGGSSRRPLPRELIASGGYDKRVILWAPDKVREFDFGSLVKAVEGDAGPRYPSEVAVLEGHTSGVRATCFSEDGQLLATGSNDNTIRIWNVAARKLVKTLRGHGGRVRAIAFAPGGKGENRQLLSGGHDQQVKIWDLHRYEEMRILEANVVEGHRDAILGAAFSPDGQHVVTASRDRTARLWNRDGRAIIEFKQGHQYLASTAAFYPDVRRLLTAAMDGTSRVWDLTNGAQLLVLKNTGASAAVALSHNAKWILTGGDAAAKTSGKGADDDGERTWPAQLWDAETGNLIRTFAAHRAEVTAVAFSSDDRLIFTGDSNGRGHLWDPQGSDNGGTLQKIHVRGITAAAFLPAGGLLTASGDNSVSQWDIAAPSDGYVMKLRQTLRHPDAVASMALSPDGTTAVTTCADKVVRLWSLQTGQPTAMILTDRTHAAKLLDVAAAGEVLQWRETELARLRQQRRTQLTVNPEGPRADEKRRKSDADLRHLDDLEQLITGEDAVNSACFSPDGKFVATTSAAGNVRLWDFQAKREVGSGPHGTAPAFKSGSGQAWSTVFAPNGAYLVTVGGSDARLWRRSDGSETIRLGPQGAVAAAHFSPNGKRVVTASWDNAARIWDVETGRLERELQGHTEYVNDAIFSLDGSRVLTSSDDKTAILWDAETGKAICRFKGHTQRIRSASLLCASPSGRVQKVVTASDDTTIRIWDSNGMLLRELKGHTKAVLDADFSPDGKYVISGGDDNRAILWDAQQGVIVRSLNGHTAGVTSVAFSPDARRAITGSRENSVKVWELKSGKELLTLKGHSQEVTGVSFSPDQKTVLTCGLDGTWIQWQASDWSGAPAAQTAAIGE